MLYWFSQWCPISPVGFLTSFLFLFHFDSLSRQFQISCLQVHWFLILPDQVCYWSSLLNFFSSGIICFSSRICLGSLWFLFVEPLILIMGCFSAFLVVYLCSLIVQWDSVRWWFLSYCKAIHRSPFLWGQLLEPCFLPLVMSCFPDSLWSL